MAFENLLSKLIAAIGRQEAIKYLGQDRPPAYDDVLHDGLVGSGEVVGTALGTTAGVLGGHAIGGVPGAVAGSVALGSLGHLAGGWAGHIGYLQGPLIKDIISHPENWTVDAAGAIVPVMPPAAAPPDANNSNDSGGQPVRRLSTKWDAVQPSSAGRSAAGFRPGVFDTGAPSLPFVTSTSTLGGVPGLLAEAGLTDPRYPGSPEPSGLPGLILQYLRSNASRSN